MRICEVFFLLTTPNFRFSTDGKWRKHLVVVKISCTGGYAPLKHITIPEMPTITLPMLLMFYRPHLTFSILLL
ncbi:hypothetical protein OESDEN_05321 [Oesophagostomum dentatum]|uniref:Uncharacterized protein n=1 Tax=Oesophagostomum dentatum TaxID=61180 RepID=A0A0B1TB16_OESDE|nr:hypothetical protein OESDEN_05321 [Oesophagostomum dentatum]